MFIDKDTFNKARRIPYDPNKPSGYQPRPTLSLAIRSLLIHTTNGNKGTSFKSEANFLANSHDVSAHYIIGKRGEIAEILDPVKYIAYHAGCVKAMAYSNPFAGGIELHNTPSEGHCTDLQLDALDWLAKDIISRFDIKKENVETHRAVAVFCKGHKFAGRLGRKIDPSGFPDNEFYAWRNTLYAPKTYTRFRVVSAVVNIRTSPQRNDHNIVGQLTYGDEFDSVAVIKDELEQFINGKNTWAHLTRGTHNGIPLDGLGFVHTSNLKPI